MISYGCRRLPAGENQVNIEDRFNQIARNFEKVNDILKPLAESIAAHDYQIEKLLEVAEKHNIAIANLEKQWQAYINTLPKT
jgi:hypothetical protein